MARVRNTQTNELNARENKANATWNIAVYIRLSKEDGNDESESVVNQKKILTEYLEEFFDDPYSVTDFYIDDGLTGTDDSRESFMRMIQDIERGKVNCILCKTLSRAFRNYSDQGHYLEYYFLQKNVRFISTGDPQLDTFKNPEVLTGYEVPITGLMNDRFACRTSSDVRRTFNTKRRNGEFIGAFPPYGYLKSPENKNRLILDREIVPIKRDMLNWILDGMSLNGVAQKLNELGVPNPTAYKRGKGWKYSHPQALRNDGLWTGCVVKRILVDRVNLGHMVQGKQRVVSYKVHDKVAVPEAEWFVKENTHEPTFSQEEYDTLKRVLQRDTRTPNGKRNVHLFAGFIRCRDCDKAMHRKVSKGIVYYFCRTYASKSKTKCTRHTVRCDCLEKAILKTIQTQICLVSSIAEILDRINEAPQVDTKSKRIEKLLTDKRRELGKIRSVSDNLYVDWKSGDITREEYRRMKDKFDAQMEQLTSAIAKLGEEQHGLDKGVTSDRTVFSEFRKYRNVSQLDRNILIELIDTIYIHERNEITVKFRYADELERILEFVDRNNTMTEISYP
ncbi:resolvase [Clostridia bacterium]|nr:resolvase [Clostridia bacterium]